MTPTVGQVRAGLDQIQGQVDALRRQVDALRRLLDGGGGAAAPAPAPSSPPASAAPSSQGGASPIAEQVLAVLHEHGPMSGAAIARHLDVSSHTLVRRVLPRMLEAGQLRAVGQRGGRRFYPQVRLEDAEVARRAGTNTLHGLQARKLRQRILAAIRRRPGYWTEGRLARELDADREHIAFECGRLLDAGEIYLRADGTYATGGPA